MEVFSSAFRDSRPPVAVVGAGAVARALALRLADRGFPVRAVVSRTRPAAEALARAVGAPVASANLADIPADVVLVALCVPDDQLADLAETLTLVQRPWERAVVLHASGALPASVLAPLTDKGAAALSFHPLQAIVRDSDAHTLDGAYVGLEGEPRAVAAGIELAAALDLRYVVVPAEAKPRYHLAAAMASNFMVTLLGMVQEVLGTVGIDRADGMAMLAPLLQGTLDNLVARGPEDALTGPVARGDIETLRQHGLALRAHVPQLVPAYAALSVETVRLAVRGGALAPERAGVVLELLARMVTTPLPGRPAESPGAAELPTEAPSPPADVAAPAGVPVWADDA